MDTLQEKIYQTYGTARIFEARVKILSLKMRVLNFVGLAIPLIIGLIFLGFGEINLYLKTIAIVLGIIQVIVFLWSIISKWDDKYQYSISALKRQEEIHSDLKQAKEDATIPQTFIERLLEKENRYNSEDIAQNITDKEKRYAMRRTLFNFQIVCPICKIQPKLLKPQKSENCDNCSNF